jgi:type I restriction enzyme S subunit
MIVFPSKWALTTLDVVGVIKTGNTPSTKNSQFYGGTIPFVKPSDLDQRLSIEKAEQCLTGDGAAHARLLRPGTVLVSCIGNLGKVGVAGVTLATNQQINSVEFRESAVNDRYGYYACRTLRPWMEKESSATTISILNKGRFATAPFVLAPLAEQKRIADKLDTVLARVDVCRERLNRVPLILNRFRQSVLAAATSGSLTADWRLHQMGVADAKLLHGMLKVDHQTVGGHTRGNASLPTEDAHTLRCEDLPVGWDVAELRDVCRPGRPITYGILKPGPELEVGVPYIRVADFPGNKLRIEGIKKTSPEIDEQFRRARLLAGDLLLSIRGSVGRLICIPVTLEGANITQDTARLSISSRVNTAYVQLALLSEDVQTRMKNATRGVAVRGINIGDVRALQIPLPSVEEQDEIVRRVEVLFSLAERLDTRLSAARAAAERLTPALLAKAFRGELVLQDPNDEPAAELLKRLAASRAADGNKPRRGRTVAVE